jgi:hypothetical protein
VTPSPPSPPNPVPEEPHAEIGREPLHEAIASARQHRRGGISIGTLSVASAASAAAAFAASHLWGSGTVLSAALTPVVVTLVSEFLRRPVDRVSATVAPIVPRPAASGSPGPAEPAETDWAPVNYEATPRAEWHPRWRLVVLTGLLAFAIVVAVFTVPELLVGHSITGAGGSGTFLSGGVKAAPPAGTPTTTTTTTTPTQTVTVQVQTTTVTVPATTTTPSVPTATTQTSPSPASTTPQATPTATTPAP